MSVNANLTCARCKEYLFEGPIQCGCGDRLCCQCYNLLSSNKTTTFICPECKSVVNVKECFKDRAVLHELREVSIPCRNQGCCWKGHADDYLGHVEACQYALVPCPYRKYGCLETFTHSSIASHEKWCKFKPVHHENGCLSASPCISSGSNTRVSRDQMEPQLKTRIVDSVRECEFKEVGCKFQGESHALEEHYKNSGREHLQLIQKTSLVMEKTLDSKHLVLAQQISDLKSEINHVHREISVKMQPLIVSMNKAESAIQNLQEGFSELALKVQTLEATTYDGIFIWKIPEVQRRRHEARTGKIISLYSAPFYTSRQGYRLCLRLYMDGDGCGKSTHLSFYLTIMKGEYDALLQWPFRWTVSLTLLDQGGDKNITQMFNPEPTSSSFQRPRNEMNIASGCPMFAPLSVLNSTSYVSDDTMFLRCQIDTSFS